MEKSVECSIEKAVKGKVYTCPYCNGSMKVKGGTGTSIKKHFYHTGETCADSESQDTHYHPLSKWFGISGSEGILLSRLSERKYTFTEIKEMIVEFNLNCKPTKAIKNFVDLGLVNLEKVSYSLNFGWSEKKYYTISENGKLFSYKAKLITLKEKIIQLKEKIQVAKKIKDISNILEQGSEFDFVSADFRSINRYSNICISLDDLYIIRFENAIKIGITQNFGRRIKEIKSDAQKLNLGSPKDHAVFTGLGYLEFYLKNSGMTKIENDFGFTEYFFAEEGDFENLIKTLYDIL